MRVKAPRQHILRILLYYLDFLRYREASTAPTVPKIIKRTAAMEISISDAPKGLIRRFALEAKV